MQHTTKYNFNLIETSDAFGPEALNTNTKEMEKVLTALETTHTADKAAQDAAIQKAQAAADTAKAIADSAFKPGQLPFVIGAYTPPTGGTVTVELGFKPSFVIIAGDEKNTNIQVRYVYTPVYSGLITPGHDYGMVTLTDTGFTVVSVSDTYPQLCIYNRKYTYIAFR